MNGQMVASVTPGDAVNGPMVASVTPCDAVNGPMVASHAGDQGSVPYKVIRKTMVIAAILLLKEFGTRSRERSERLGVSLMGPCYIHKLS